MHKMLVGCSGIEEAMELNMHNAKMKIMIKGDKKSIHLWQNMKILEYMSKHNGNRPPLNLSNW